MEPRFQVLILEGDAFLAASLAEALDQLGFATRVAATVEAGAAVLESGFRPDLVLLEQDMPDHPGDQVCRELRAAPETREIPVLLVSVLEDEELTRLAAAAGATGVLRKPFSPVRVVEWLHQNAGSIAARRVLPPLPLHSLPSRRPSMPPPAPAPGQEIRIQQTVNPSETMAVLVVDDDPVALAILEDVLGDEGYDVHTAAGWSDFRKLIVTVPFGVLVLDVNLPHLTGDKLALFVQNFVEPPRPRILLHSSIDGARLRQLADSVGAMGAIQKGDASTSVVEKVNQAAVAFAREWQAFEASGGVTTPGG